MSNLRSDLLFDEDARSKMISGVDVLANAVKITLGPKGKNVAIYRPGTYPHLTKDGVTVANVINLEDPFENLGAQLVKEAAQRSAEVAGDGTTTSTVLAQHLLHEGKKIADSGVDIRQYCAGIEHAAKDVLEELEKSKIAIETKQQLIDVATISANGESQIGKLVADSIEKVTEDGAISVEQARGFETELNIVDGTVIDRGYLSPYFINDQESGTCSLEKTLVFIYDSNLSTAKDILPILEYTAAADASLLIIATDVTNEALQTLVLNKIKGSLKVCAIKAPEFGAVRTLALQDLAALCNGTVISSSDSSLKEDFAETLGYAEKVIIDKNGTLLVGTNTDRENLCARCESVKKAIEDPSTSTSDLAVAKRRLRRMSDGVAVIKVGGATETEMLERKDRIEDALYAAKAAKKGGIQPGGGTAILAASTRIKLNKIGKDASFVAGYQTLRKICRSPLHQIVDNAGEIPEIVIRKVERNRQRNFGYDAKNNKYGIMNDLGIIDPHLVVCSSLKHAVSVACNILLVGCAVSLVEEKIDSNLGIIEHI